MIIRRDNEIRPQMQNRRSLLGQGLQLPIIIATTMGVSGVLNRALAQQAGKPLTGPNGRALKLVVFGDSLVAGYQLPASAAFPQQLEAALRGLGHKVDVVNAGVSGDTTAAGLDRLAWAVPDDADGVIVELGANDMLRGLSPAAARANLEKIVRSIRGKGKPVLIAGMRASQTLGKAYAEAFDSIYPDLANTHDLLLYPFFLDGIALRPELNLRDGIHPNAQGVAEVVKRMTPLVLTLLERMAATAKA